MKSSFDVNTLHTPLVILSLEEIMEFWFVSLTVVIVFLPQMDLCVKMDKAEENATLGITEEN